MATKFDRILDTCLDRAINKGEDLRHCLEDYPELAKQLDPLLRIALSVRAQVMSIQSSPEFKSLVREYFRVQIDSGV